MKAMLKNIKYILATASAVLMLGSCQDFLNTPPVGSLPGDGYYTTPAHVEQGVRGGYALLRDIELHHYLSFSEDRSDNVWVDPVVNGIRICSEASYWRSSLTNSTEAADLWAGWYEIINNVNTVLAAINNVEFTDDNVKNQFEGELYFLRGYAHFELARMFGNVPIVDHVLSNSEANALKQSSPAEVINNRAIVDLKQAETLLPYEDGMTNYAGSTIWGEGRADKVVAQAMLARVYMTLKGYPYYDANAKTEAIAYLDKVLKYSSDNGDKYWAPTIDEWKKQWMTDPNISNKYQIFAIQHRVSSGNNLSSNSGLQVTGEYLPNGGPNGGLMSPVMPEAYLRYEYVSNNDPRGLDLAFIDGFPAWGGNNAYSNQSITIEYEGQDVTSMERSINTKWIPYANKRTALGITFDDTTLGGWPLNFPIIRLEDMMLLRAELYVEDGQVSEAMKIVNKIRERAKIDLRPESPSPDEAMEYVKMERRLEFYLEGIRWFDEVRYGTWVDDTFAKFDRYKINGADREGVGRSTVTEGRDILPIPFNELQAVPGLYVQNPAWN